jgi:hypothetical protein
MPYARVLIQVVEHRRKYIAIKRDVRIQNEMIWNLKRRSLSYCYVVRGTKSGIGRKMQIAHVLRNVGWAQSIGGAVVNQKNPERARKMGKRSQAAFKLRWRSLV